MNLSTLALAKKAANALLDKKAENITVLKLPRQVTLFNYFVIAEALSPNHAQALGQHLKEEMKKAKQPILALDGMEAGQWVLLDLGTVIVHIFQPPFREYYDLETLWPESKSIEFEIK